MKNYKIISFQRDFKFYLTRAFKHMDIGNIRKALLHFDKASIINPTDISVQFNRAGIMSEIGSLEESNKILKNIIENIDESAGECYFGMGCNYLQMEKMKEARTYFNKYMEKFPNGEYSEEAQELAELIDEIFLDKKEERSSNNVYDKVKDLIETGKMARAEKRIKLMLEKNPKDVKAISLMALLCYHKHNYDEALRLCKQGLSIAPDSLEINCNLILIYNGIGNKRALSKVISNLTSKKYQSIEDLYRIAITFGSIGRHYYCFVTFKEIIALFSENLLFLHFTALSLYNQGFYNYASAYWREMLKIDSSNLVALKYLDLIREINNGIVEFREEEYRFHIPKHYYNQFKIELKEIARRSKQEITALWNEESDFRAKVYWAIRQDDKEVIQSTLDILNNMDKDESSIIIEELILNYAKKDKLLERAKAMLEQNIGQPSLLIDMLDYRVNYHTKELVKYILGLLNIDKDNYKTNYDILRDNLKEYGALISDNWSNELLAAVECSYIQRTNTRISKNSIYKKHKVTAYRASNLKDVANQIIEVVLSSLC